MPAADGQRADGLAEQPEVYREVTGGAWLAAIPGQRPRDDVRAAQALLAALG